MRTESNAPTQAFVIQTGSYLLLFAGPLMAFVSAPTPMKVSRPADAQLNFARRVSDQRAIEEVYWRQRTWPKAFDDKNALSSLIASHDQRFHKPIPSSIPSSVRWNSQRPGPCDRPHERELPRSLDEMVSDFDQPDEPHSLPLSLPWVQSSNRSRHHFLSLPGILLARITLILSLQ